MDYTFYINSCIAHLYLKFKHTPLKESNISRILFGIASLLSFFEKFYVCTQPNKYFRIYHIPLNMCQNILACLL